MYYEFEQLESLFCEWQNFSEMKKGDRVLQRRRNREVVIITRRESVRHQLAQGNARLHLGRYVS